MRQSIALSRQGAPRTPTASGPPRAGRGDSATYREASVGQSRKDHRPTRVDRRDAGLHALLMIDLGDAPGVVARVDDALRWFKASGSRHPFVGHWAGVSLPAEIATLINELDQALTRVSPTDADVSSEKWLHAWQFTRRASDAIREGGPGVGIQEAEEALRSIRDAFKRPRPDRVSPPDEDDVKLFLRHAKISPPPWAADHSIPSRWCFYAGSTNGALTSST